MFIEIKENEVMRNEIVREEVHTQQELARWRGNCCEEEWLRLIFKSDKFQLWCQFYFGNLLTALTNSDHGFDSDHLNPILLEGWLSGWKEKSKGR